MYIVGIDVGGTNTDAALLKGSEVVAMAKVPTNHDDLFLSTKKALQEVLEYYQEQEPIHLHLSTTLSTNIIVEGKGVPTEVVAVPGPGANLASHAFPFPVHEVDGYIDHRGREVSPLDVEQVATLRECIDPSVALGVAGKFSQRNPSQEQKLGQILAEGRGGTISYGHRLSGQANFPRRIVTTYLNASVAQHQEEFTIMWEELQSKLGIPLAEILILKADGGTMTLSDSRERPVETILSGPAASIMGVQALTTCEQPNFVIVDIGGTTTDLAVVVEGQVLFERQGATILGYKTLVPALLTRSIGLGGDSELHFQEGAERVKVGPRRAGLPVCRGGNKLTPTDAVVALGFTSFGDRQRAIGAWEKWASELGLAWEKLAKLVVEAFTRQLSDAIEALYGELENVPLYTISEVINPPQIRPEAVVGLGAPAEVFVPLLAEHLKLPHEIVPFSAGANAIGAGAAQPTIGLTLHGDTELGTVTIPEMGCQKLLSRPLFFTAEKARELATKKTQEHARAHGYDPSGEVYVVEEEQFNLVRGFHTVGQVFTVRTQLRPKVRKIRGGIGHD